MGHAEQGNLPERQMRIADTDRDLVIDQLQQATSEGRITIDEFQERARAVYDAQFASDLVPITADLPATTIAATPTKSRTRWLVSIMGGDERSGTWDPGDQSIALTVMGGQTLDLTQVAAVEVSITAITVMGATEIIVPDGAVVDMSGLIVMGGSSNETTSTGNSLMRVSVRSFGAMGGCEVRNLSDKERAKRLPQPPPH
jgi:hypothetical protein